MGSREGVCRGQGKAPGPDGFTLAFFQVCWRIVKDELFETIAEFLDIGSPRKFECFFYYHCSKEGLRDKHKGF